MIPEDLYGSGRQDSGRDLEAPQSSPFGLKLCRLRLC